MCDFVAGFAVRHDLAPAVLDRAFAPPGAFSAAGVRTASAAPDGPRHFHPAAPGHKPTAGWDPLDPEPTVEPDRHAEGYAEGYAAGVADAQAAAAALAADTARDAAMLGSLADALAGRFDREAMADRLRRTVLMLVERLVGETGVSADLLTARIDAATALLAEPEEAALLRVHPDDVALLDGRLPQHVFAAGDPHVARGSFVLESASSVVEDGPALWLEQLTAAIDRIPLPASPAQC